MSLRNLAIASVILSLFFAACETAEEAFVGNRAQALCDEAYMICHKPAGCVLDRKHFVEGSFPGSNRVVIATEENSVTLEVRIFISQLSATGTELIMRAYEPDCTLNTRESQEHLIDVDIFQRAGDDHTMIFDLQALNKGEHLLEIYSDASAQYVLVVEQK